MRSLLSAGHPFTASAGFSVGDFGEVADDAAGDPGFAIAIFGEAKGEDGDGFGANLRFLGASRIGKL